MVNLIRSSGGKVSLCGNPPGRGMYAVTELVVKLSYFLSKIFRPYLLSFLYQWKHFSSLPSELLS